MSSNDCSLDKPVDLSSLGVVDLDTSILPYVFGLRAIDSREPVTRVLLGNCGNSVCVLVLDAAATPMAFHDIILENLAGTPDYRARRIVPSEVTSLRRRWSSVLFETMHKRQADMSYLCRACRGQYDSEFGGGRAGTCPHCGIYIICNLGRHTIDHHLERGQLWLCPVDWCTVWKGSVKDCLDQLHSKHDVAQFMGLKTLLGKFCPSWTVSREFWRAALRPDMSGVATDVKLLQESGCR